MAFATVLLYLIVVYVRPGEIIPGWEGFPFALITELVAAAAVALSLVMRPRGFLNQPHDRYVAGFFAAAILSNPAWGWFGGAWPTVVALAPTMLCYVLVRVAVRSARQLRWAGYVLVALTLFQAANGISQFRSGVGLGGVAAIQQLTGVEETGESGEPDEVRRIRGTGIFNDPNDVALAFVMALPFLFGPIVARTSGLTVRVLASAAAAPVVAALFYTNSRGGILGLGAILVPYCFRFGKAAGTVVAMLGLTALLALGPSRMSQVNSEEDSAQGRVQSWSAGLQMLKSRPILGVGFDRYTEFNRLVAHNSFVHTLGELGLVGGFFFTGMFYWALRRPAPARPQAERTPESEALTRWGEDLRIGTLGMLVCAMFLSRQYVVVLFVWIALGACYRQVLHETEPKLKTATGRDNLAVLAITVGGVAAVYIAVRVLAVWSGI